jgi:hypothetical protein
MNKLLLVDSTKRPLANQILHDRWVLQLYQEESFPDKNAMRISTSAPTSALLNNIVNRAQGFNSEN